MKMKTVYVKGSDGNPMLLNEDDYDKKKHGALLEGDDIDALDANAEARKGDGSAQTGEVVKETTMQTEQRRVMTYDPTAPSTPIIVPGTAAQTGGAPASTVTGTQRFVAKVGKKWFIVSAMGEKLADEGYATEAEARAAIGATGGAAVVPDAEAGEQTEISADEAEKAANGGEPGNASPAGADGQ